jgi:group II intron reverse transcriptase/maturase
LPKILLKKIAKLKNLVLAYQTIKTNPGKRPPPPPWGPKGGGGIDEISLDGLDLKYLENTRKKLRKGEYQFPAAPPPPTPGGGWGGRGRRVMIPKPGKDEKRPLTVASPRDKIVQKAMQQVMEIEYDKIFLPTSHGFRPNKGVHTALQHVEAKFQSVRYIIEADLSKAFDSIDHKKLIEILKRDIKCTRTLQLVKSALKAGYVKMGTLHDNLDKGTPQGSILSPLLCNIFLHELDLEMEKVMKEFNNPLGPGGEKRSRSKEYQKLANRIKYMKKNGLDVTRPEEFKSKKEALIKTPSLRHDESYVRVQYVRYADDFIIGVEGSLKTTKAIMARVREFIQSGLGLKLNEAKIIVDFTKEPVKFLGYKLLAPNAQGIEKPVETYSTAGGRLVSRRKKIRIRIAMDYVKVVRKLVNEGFAKERNDVKSNTAKKIRGTFQGNLINLDHADILTYYNSKIRGIYNYYNFVCNMDKVAHVI